MQLCPEAAAQLNHAYARLNHGPLQAASVRDAAGGATAAVAVHVQPRNVAAVVPFLLDGMAPACAWQTKVLFAQSRLLQFLAAVQENGAFGGHRLQCMHGSFGLLCRKQSGGRLSVSLFHTNACE